jgi:hypothetical protein
MQHATKPHHEHVTLQIVHPRQLLRLPGLFLGVIAGPPCGVNVAVDAIVAVTEKNAVKCFDTPSKFPVSVEPASHVVAFPAEDMNTGLVVGGDRCDSSRLGTAPGRQRTADSFPCATLLETMVSSVSVLDRPRP